MIEAVRPRTGIAESPRAEAGRRSVRTPQPRIRTPARIIPMKRNVDGVIFDGEYSRT